MRATLVVATRAGNVTRCATGRGVYESASRINAIPRAGSKEDRKGHGRCSRNTKRSDAAHSVDQDSDEKAEQRETIQTRHDAPEQCQNPSMATLSAVKAQTTLNAIGKGARAPVSSGPRAVASPVTSTTRSAVATARAGRSHHGVGNSDGGC